MVFYDLLLNCMAVGQASASMKKLSSMGWCLMLDPPWLNLRFSLALPINESLAMFFLSFLCDDALHKLGNIHAS